MLTPRQALGTLTGVYGSCDGVSMGFESGKRATPPENWDGYQLWRQEVCGHKGPLSDDWVPRGTAPMCTTNGPRGYRGYRGGNWFRGGLDCGWSLLNHGVAEIKRLNLGNLNPIYERELNKLNVH